MTQAFLDAASVLENQAVQRWKATGGKVVAYSCSYVPDEVFHAAGILPYRLRSVGVEEMTIADTYFGPFVCSVPKCMLQLAGAGKYRFLDGVVITPGCDSMRRLDECWRKAAEEHEGILPRFFFHFGVPHKSSEHTVRWFAQEIRRLIAAVEAHFDVTITEEALGASIRTYNRGRELLGALEQRRRLPAPALSGAEALAVVLASVATPREGYNEALEALLGRLHAIDDRYAGRARLLLVGSASDDVELLRVLEGETAVVVADNLCFGVRAQEDRVAEQGDPVQALAQRYLSKNECPRMYGQYELRLRQLRETIDAAGVEGAVLQNVRFCDLHGAENGLFERDLEAAGVPCVRVERECGQLVDTGRLRLRVHALVERITQRRKATS